MDSTKIYIFDYVIFGSGAAGSILAKYLSKDNKVALIDIASKKKSKQTTRFVPPFVDKFTKNYTPTISGNFGGNTDLWSGKCYLLTPEEMRTWPIKYSEILKFSKILAKEMNIDHKNICHLVKKDHNSYFHRSQRGVLGNIFDCLNIEFNENIHCFQNLTIKRFFINPKSKKITQIVISNTNEEITIILRKSIILCCGGLGNIPIYNHFIKGILKDSKEKKDFRLCDHAHFKIGSVSSNVMPNIHKGYLYSKRQEFEDCLIVFNKSANFAFQIDGKKIGSDFFLNIYRQNNNKFLKKLSYFLYRAQAFLTKLFLILVTFGKFINEKSIEIFIEEPSKSKSKISISNKKWFNSQLEMINIDYHDPILDFNHVIRKIKKLTDNKVRRINKNSFKRKNMLVGLHPSCSTPIKKDAKLGELDTNLQIKGFTNLFMVGTNVFPSNGVTNPTWTLMVLSRKLAHYLEKNNNKNKIN